MTDDEALDALLESERRIWDALVAGDARAVERLLAADFLGVSPAGFAGRADHVAQVRQSPGVETYRLRSPRVRRFTDAAALLIYEASYRLGGRRDDDTMFVSSLWELRNGSWVNTFSQDTVSDPDQVLP